MILSSFFSVWWKGDRILSCDQGSTAVNFFLSTIFFSFPLGLIHAWITSQVFRNCCELLWITMNYSELLWIVWITPNYYELLGFLIIFPTGLLIFQLGYLNFSTGLCLCYVFLVFCPTFFINYWIIIIFFCWVIIFLLGHLGISTGFCWGYVFWQLIRSELLWITVNCCELLCIAVNYCELLELLWITALLNSSWRKYIPLHLHLFLIILTLLIRRLAASVAKRMAFFPL
jgi:hypothetical protein